MRAGREGPSEFRAKTRAYAGALAMLWRAAPLETAWLAAMLALQGLVPPLSIWLTKLVVDALGSGGADLPRLVALWGVSLAAGGALAPWVALVTGNLNERLTAHVNLRLIEKANRLPDLAPFETPGFYDDLQVLAQGAGNRPLNLIVNTVSLGRDLVAALGLLALLGSLAPWLPLLVLAATLPQARLGIALQERSWRALLGASPEAREMRYFSELATGDAQAKEVRLFGLGPLIEERYRAAFERLHRSMRGDRRRQALAPLPAVALSLAGNLFAFAWVVGRASGGALSPGDVLLLVQALAGLQTRLADLAQTAGWLWGQLLFFEKLFAFLGYRSRMPLASPGRPAPAPLACGVRFEGVGFRYPDGRVALEAVSFTIRAGERVALVGENGAGKSTVVKLLARLYDPTEGAVLVDDADLRDLDLEGWRSGLGAVFQDFGRYHLTVAENVALGRPAALHEPERLRAALHEAGLEPQSLPDGLDTRLGKPFGGTELSGGQWQKIAVARAFVRDAELLILDEPTAALDPRAEHALYKRFAELSRGKTALLVTHRLASVQMADRILVLKGGRLVEEGTHAELLRLGGEYAALYRMQAEHYQASAAS